MAHITTQNRSPKIERLPDYRLRVTRIWDVQVQVPKTPADLQADCWQNWGISDVTYPQCRLIKQDVSGQIGTYEEPTKEPPQLIKVFEEIDQFLETRVGNVDVSVDDDGIYTIRDDAIQFSAGTAIYQIPGVTPAQAPFQFCVLKTQEDTDDGTVRIIKRTYISKGLISQTDETKNNGSLLLRTLVYINQVPPTPAGYTVINQKVDHPNGLPLYTYTFAKGTGQISNQIEYRLSPDTGATGMTVTTIKYLSTPLVAVNPITPPVAPGTVNVSITYDDADGYRMWTAVYASGKGTIATTTETRNNGKLKIYSSTAINAAPSTPAATIGGIVTLIKQDQRNGTRFEDGTIIYEYQWAEGYGLIDSSIVEREGGLREATYISLGTALFPVGPILSENVEQIEGTQKFTIRTMQSATGLDPTAFTYTVPRRAHFTFPGRAKAYTATSSNGYNIADLFLSPPVETEVDATVAVSYQTSSAIGSLPYTIWQPLDGAVVQAEWIGLNSVPGWKVSGLRGYRSVSATPVTVTASAWGGGTGGVMLGNIIFGGTTAKITVTGGPVAPDGNTYVLDYGMEPAFTDALGNVYYRKTIIYATIPSQPALPV